MTRKESCMRKSLRFFALLLAVLFVFPMLASCGGGKDMDVEAAAREIQTQYNLQGGYLFLSSATELGEYLDEDLIRGYYGDALECPDFSQVESYGVYIDESKPVCPCEYGIFKMKDGADSDAFMAYLKARIDATIENAKSYPSVDTSMLTTAVFRKSGKYIWYTAVKDANAPIDALLQSKIA